MATDQQSIRIFATTGTYRRRHGSNEELGAVFFCFWSEAEGEEADGKT